MTFKEWFNRLIKMYETEGILSEVFMLQDDFRDCWQAAQREKELEMVADTSEIQADYEERLKAEGRREMAKEAISKLVEESSEVGANLSLEFARWLEKEAGREKEAKA